MPQVDRAVRAYRFVVRFFHAVLSSNATIGRTHSVTLAFNPTTNGVSVTKATPLTTIGV